MPMATMVCTENFFMVFYLHKSIYFKLSPKIHLKEPLERFDSDPPGIAGSDVIGPGKGTLIDGHSHAIQAVHISQRLTHIYLRKALGIEDNIAVNAAGVIFDGDADRAMFVDELGEFVQPDYLTPFVARATLAELKVEEALPKIIYDIRTSRGAIETLSEMGCDGVMVPVGHAFAKPILRSSGAICGGELAGHYYFSEFFGCDSGVLAALRILTCVSDAKRDGRTMSQMMASVVGRYANSGELNFKVPDKDAAIARALECARVIMPAEICRSNIDGVRIEYKEGWINIRKSNTEPYLRLIVEADTRARLEKWVSLLTGAIEN